MRSRFALAALFALGCGGEVTFRDRPIVWVVDDDHTIPEPAEEKYNRFSHYGDAFLFDSLDRTLTIADQEIARDLNSIDEVVDSTWFENRIGRYALTPEDIVGGPGGAPPRLPLTVTRGKADGANPGFVAKDADGRKFVIKLDPVDQPEMQTSNAVIASRIFWALGYHVPSEHVIAIRRSDLALDPKAKLDEGIHEGLPFTGERLDKLFTLSAPPVGGVYRALASELLKGKPKGGFRDRGVRSDDPNDTIPHEHRRSLRGLQVFAAWLDHTDMNPQNTLDMYVEENGRRFLRHHLVDFGETLGAHALDHPWISYSHFFDPGFVGLSFLSLGLWKRPWEDEPGRPFRSVGLYFPNMDMRAWREAKPYYPFRERTLADAFWAAKLVMRFERPHIEALVAEAHMGDAAAAGYLVETILARRRSVGLAYMTEVTALDWLDVKRDRICMVDLAVRYHLAEGGEVRVTRDGASTERSPIDARGNVCIAGPGRAARARYELSVVRGGEAKVPIEVHVAGGDDAHLTGLIRDF